MTKSADSGNAVERVREALLALWAEAGAILPPNAPSFPEMAEIALAALSRPTLNVTGEARLEGLLDMIRRFKGPVISFDVCEPYYLASCDVCG